MKKDKHALIDKAMEGLKDFQEWTVQYVYRQLFQEDRTRMLVADEVGLGKTIVAKGVIAKAYQQYLEERSRKGFHVVYICSNQALAQQNLKKLNLFGDKKITNSVGRLIYLTLQSKASKSDFRISSLTPGTSIHLTRSKGQQDERAIIYALLTRYHVFKVRKNGVKWILKGDVRATQWDKKVKEYGRNRWDLIRPELFQQFKQALRDVIVTAKDMPNTFEAFGKKERSLWKVLQRLSKKVDGRNHKNFNFQYELIIRLRQILTEICIDFLDADLFILDEFQRFKELIDGESETTATQLARKIFAKEGAKVLMLSATPYKPYTTRFDHQLGDDHYKEFKKVFEFLLGSQSEQFWQEYEEDRRRFFEFMRHPEQLKKGLEQAKIVKKDLETKYRRAMVRTERSIVVQDHNAMIKTKDLDQTDVRLEDIQDFIRLDQIINRLNKQLPHKIANVLSFVKSAPFALSFLDHYKAKEELRKYKDDPEVNKALQQFPEAWLDLKAINDYQALKKRGYPNAKLRQLIRESVDNGGYKLLWIPPSLPYYQANGVYKETKGMSKMLIFSSWVMVPKMISTLVSYEVERRTIPQSITEQEQAESRFYFPKGSTGKSNRRQPRRQFNFTVKGKQARNMTNFCLLYPSPTLANLYSPRENLSSEQSLESIRSTISDRIRKIIKKNRLFERYGSYDGTSEKWYWALPVLLDKLNISFSKEVEAWLSSQREFSGYNTDPEADQEEMKVDKTGKQQHFEELKEAFLDPDAIKLGEIPEDIGEVVTDLILGSPAIAAFRSLDHFFDKFKDVMSGAVMIAYGFLSLYNKPESIAAIRLSIKSQRYWQMALKYGVEGNIQSLLDEYIYIYHDCENEQKSALELGKRIADVMNIRTTNHQVDSLQTFLNGNSARMRCHYAIDYGSQRIETTSGEKRMINLRETFNSPFRPFVLASTSIGQEGLDFHYYCRKIMHWNLPANAIDIEQREGRINRFKGLAIRQNIACKHADKLNVEEGNAWRQLFKLAEKDKKSAECDLIPFWHVEAEDDLKIERFVPLYPFSKDRVKYKNILKVLTYYRLTFGQPRQEELVETFRNADFTEEEWNEIRKELMINLSPICF